ncbi:glycosyl hydrolase [Podospora australis]|uniref:Glycosyl hydrolase n=1 Tax=Podospora australis TaxID=1536484 RepID=A0AAN6WTA7_9PEZI|nr:glycosyl hydrolase [Podospora australis]
MRLLAALTSVLGFGSSLVKAQAVFAHFMVGNTRDFAQSDWVKEMTLAKNAGFDAFALNMANKERTTETQLPLAFNAAASVGFKLLFSFDYAGNGAWEKETVRDMINEYGPKSTYFKRGSKPLVSTFEGPGSAQDWVWIKDQTSCFFIPDWSSIGAQPATKLAGGVADGLFSWDAWPKGPDNMTTYPDASYYDFLGSKPYMMPISPWFYTNMPGFDKNWIWKGDDLWFQRWQQAISLDRRPDYIQVISWNDYGESHYIGPLDDRQYEAFAPERGNSPFNYVEGMPHDGWRETLPYFISVYKAGIAAIDQERLVSWYRIHKNGVCSDGGTTGNTANQLQFEYPANAIMSDRVFYDAVLTSNAQVQVSIGGVVQAGSWDQEPWGGVGVYHGSVPIGSASGTVIVTLKRGGTTIATINGASITSSCPNGGLQNYNPWVGSARGPIITAVAMPKNLHRDDMSCVKGFGVFDFIGMCDFSCHAGYCPSAACICLKKGVASPPPETGKPGYPLPGKTGSFMGLCSFNCAHNYCPPEVCGYTPSEGVILGYSPFLPPACTGGVGPAGPFQGLCDFGCHFGFCPIAICTCTATGILIDAPPKVTNETGYFLDGNVNDHGLCKFAVEHGYPPDVCGRKAVDKSGEAKTQTVTLDPAVWGAPTAQCAPPCVLVLPPSILATSTTISLPRITTSLEFGWTTTSGGSTFYTATTITTIISVPPVTTDRIHYSNVHVTLGVDGGIPTSIWPMPSVSPPPITLIPTPPSAITASPVPRIIRPPPWPFGDVQPSSPATPGASTSTTSTAIPPIVIGPFPTTVFPTETASWVTNYVSEPTTTEVNGQPVPVIPCWVWFIWVCPPNFGGIILFGFRLPGIYPAGGPPRIGPGPLPPGLDLKKIWPQITIGPNLKPTFPSGPDPENDDVCETATASFCTTTLSYGVMAKRTLISGPVVTEAPVIPFAEFNKLERRATTTKTSTISTCKTVTGCGETDITSTTATQSVETPWPRVVIPKSHNFVVSLRSSLERQFGSQAGYFESKTDALGTLFFYIPRITLSQANALQADSSLGIASVHIPRGPGMLKYGKRPAGLRKRGLDDELAGLLNKTEPELHVARLGKRAQTSQANAELAMVALSWPPGAGPVPPLGSRGAYNFDSSAGEGTFMYLVDYGVDASHDEFRGQKTVIPLYPGPYRASGWFDNDDKRHGTACLSKMFGKTYGVARKATVYATTWDFNQGIYEHYLDALALVHSNIVSNPGRGSKSVINLSIAIEAVQISDAYQDTMAYLIRAILDTGAVFVTGSGNKRGPPTAYPALFGNPANRNYISDVIVVGSVLPGGYHIGAHNFADWLTCYAPGHWNDLTVATSDLAFYPDGYKVSTGTSYSGATVAGLAAYFRGLDSTLTTAASVKRRIQALAYQRPRITEGVHPQAFWPSNVVWNGQQAGGPVVCSSSSSAKMKRQNGGSCDVNFPTEPSPIGFRTGDPQPTCAAGSVCGVGCKGYFCENTPVDVNPDFLDPRNPDSVQNPSAKNYGDWDGASSTSKTSTRTTSTSSRTTSTQTPTPTPDGPLPKAGAKWEMTFYDLRDDTQGIAGHARFYGYDDNSGAYCTPEPYTWRSDAGKVASVPSSLTGITVYGDSSCRFTSSDMKLRCNKWATVTCTRGSGGGTCRIRADLGIYETWTAILYCVW